MTVDQELVRLTPQQRRALTVLQENAQTATQLADAMLPGEPYMTYDRAHALLARLERRGLVTRANVGRRSVWSITDAGGEALA